MFVVLLPWTDHCLKDYYPKRLEGVDSLCEKWDKKEWMDQWEPPLQW